MPSFDIVSEVDSHEVANAVDQANREISTRFDFKGVDASFELDGESVKAVAEADFQLRCRSAIAEMRESVNSILESRPSTTTKSLPSPCIFINGRRILDSTDIGTHIRTKSP